MLCKIDVVILSWNRLNDTMAAIDSCLSQDSVDIYVYVVDQGSEIDIINALQNNYMCNHRVILKCLGENVGVSKGRNIGYLLGSSPYIFSLDNDAKLVNNGTLYKAVKKMEVDKKISVLSFRIINYTDGEDGQNRSFATVYDNCLEKEFDSVRFAGGAHVIRRSVFEGVDGYDSELFFGGEEEELSRKVINTGGIIRYDPELKVIHRCMTEGRVSWKGQRFYYLVRNRLYIRMKFGESFTKILTYAFGYLIKGIINKVFVQAFKGCIDSIILYRKFRKTSSNVNLYKENSFSKQYFKKNEENLRGGILQKIRKELLAKLPEF